MFHYQSSPGDPSSELRPQPLPRAAGSSVVSVDSVPEIVNVSAEGQASVESSSSVPLEEDRVW